MYIDVVTDDPLPENCAKLEIILQSIFAILQI